MYDTVIKSNGTRIQIEDVEMLRNKNKMQCNANQHTRNKSQLNKKLALNSLHYLYPKI